jgi:hypothetical protein
MGKQSIHVLRNRQECPRMKPILLLIAIFSCDTITHLSVNFFNLHTLSYLLTFVNDYSKKTLIYALLRKYLKPRDELWRFFLATALGMHDSTVADQNSFCNLLGTLYIIRYYIDMKTVAGFTVTPVASQCCMNTVQEHSCFHQVLLQVHHFHHSYLLMYGAETFLRSC